LAEEDKDDQEALTKERLEKDARAKNNGEGKESSANSVFPSFLFILSLIIICLNHFNVGTYLVFPLE